MNQENSAFRDRFCVSMERMFGKDSFPEKVAVGVSGGADSMALMCALADYVQEFYPGTEIYALSVDHCLRRESGDEARFVAEAAGELVNVPHHILVWEDGGEQRSKIEESAREARYGLLFGFMAERDIRHLFIAHHQNDQAETFLFRLAKGSGLDGLACMEEVSEKFHNGEGYTLCRPFLGEQKSDILDYVSESGIPYIEDPSNQSDKFARVRLRQSMDVLAKEGLSPKRLYTTAKRLERARDAISYVSDIEYKNSIKSKYTNTIVLKSEFLHKCPLEIVIRIVLRAMEELKGECDGYGPRLERVEVLCEDLVREGAFRKRTLNGIIFERVLKTDEVVLSLEK